MQGGWYVDGGWPPQVVSLGLRPVVNGSLWSCLSFSWVDPLMARGNQKPLEMSDLWEVAEHDRMTALSNQFKVARTDQGGGGEVTGADAAICLLVRHAGGVRAGAGGCAGPQRDGGRPEAGQLGPEPARAHALAALQEAAARHRSHPTRLRAGKHHHTPLTDWSVITTAFWLGGGRAGGLADGLLVVAGVVCLVVRCNSRLRCW